MKYMNNPDASGPITEPYDVRPSLAYLVSSGQLDSVDIVFPNVIKTAEVTRYINVFCKKHRDIVLVTWNPESRVFPLSGQQPLHLQAWFRPSATKDIQELLGTIKKRYATK